EGIPLAAGWLDIGAYWEGSLAQITWATSWEEQADYFDVERSGDGLTFEAVGRVAAQGHSRERTAYRFEDQGPAEAPASGRVYYRVRQTGTDGRTALSEQVELPWRALAIRLQVSPNPFVEVLDIEAFGTRSAEMHLRICDAGGRLLASQVLAAGEERCQFYLEGLEPGIYFFEARCENWQEHRKLIRK
ncbi:MAG: T9SS C-terminal target domain-containing protein, partial [Bacteroidetes bacterium]